MFAVAADFVARQPQPTSSVVQRQLYEAIATSAGHSLVTAAESYCSQQQQLQLQTSDAQVSSAAAQFAVGVHIVWPPSPPPPASGDIAAMASPSAHLLLALRSATQNGNAAWRYDEQRELARAVCDRRDDVVAVLPCGYGKLLCSALVPAFYDAASAGGVVPSVIVVVVPLVSLLASHAAQAAVAAAAGISCVCIGGGRGGASELRSALLEASVAAPVQLALIVVDALNADDVLDILASAAQRRRLRHVVVDEAHVVLSEFALRPAMLAVRQLRLLRVPLIVTSATLPVQLRRVVSELLGLTPSIAAQRAACDIVCAELPVARHVRVELRYVPPLVQLQQQRDGGVLLAHLVTEAIRILIEWRAQAAAARATASIHVVCATVATALAIAQVATQHWPTAPDGASNIALVHGDMSAEDKSEHVAAWCSGDIRVLISTTAAVCGVHSEYCTHVLVVGSAHGILDVAQAFGRCGRSSAARSGSYTPCAALLFDPSHHGRLLAAARHERTLPLAALLQGELGGDAPEFNLSELEPQSVAAFALGTAAPPAANQQHPCVREWLAAALGAGEAGSYRCRDDSGDGGEATTVNALCSLCTAAHDGSEAIANALAARAAAALAVPQQRGAAHGTAAAEAGAAAAANAERQRAPAALRSDAAVSAAAADLLAARPHGTGSGVSLVLALGGSDRTTRMASVDVLRANAAAFASARSHATGERPQPSLIHSLSAAGAVARGTALHFVKEVLGGRTACVLCCNTNAACVRERATQCDASCRRCFRALHGGAQQCRAVLLPAGLSCFRCMCWWDNGRCPADCNAMQSAHVYSFKALVRAIIKQEAACDTGASALELAARQLYERGALLLQQRLLARARDMAHSIPVNL